MSTPKVLRLEALRPLVRFSNRLHQHHHHHHLPLTQRRTLLPSPLAAFSPAPSSPQVLTASRTLAYPSSPIYSIIADVPSYASFLPYCQRSDITKWSAPDRTWKRQWPSEGILTSGFGGVTESFASRVYCVPGKVVESVCGDAETSLRKDDIDHHLNDDDDDDNGAAQTRYERREGSGLLSHLRSTWTIESLASDKTQVTLSVEFAFTNPLYAALSGAAAPKAATFMIDAFERRVKTLLDGNPNMTKASLAELDGSRLKQK